MLKIFSFIDTSVLYVYVKFLFMKQNSSAVSQLLVVPCRMILMSATSSLVLMAFRQAEMTCVFDLPTETKFQPDFLVPGCNGLEKRKYLDHAVMRYSRLFEFEFLGYRVNRSIYSDFETSGVPVFQH